jgi:hypothetical protein
MQTTETTHLLTALTAQRRHVLGIIDGLADAELRRPILPSGWACLGLIQHLAVDVEQFWFAGTVAGDQDLLDRLVTTPTDAWQVGTDISAVAVLDQYRAHIERADTILGAVDFDAAPAAWPSSVFGAWRLATVREVVLHVLTETACHAGHLDAARELIDRRQWLVLD